MDVENHGRIMCKMETTGYMKFQRSSSEIRSVSLDTSRLLYVKLRLMH
jgi:hypothetical protein